MKADEVISSLTLIGIIIFYIAFTVLKIILQDYQREIDCLRMGIASSKKPRCVSIFDNGRDMVIRTDLLSDRTAAAFWGELDLSRNYRLPRNVLDLIRDNFRFKVGSTIERPVLICTISDATKLSLYTLLVDLDHNLNLITKVFRKAGDYSASSFEICPYVNGQLTGEVEIVQVADVDKRYWLLGPQLI